MALVESLSHESLAPCLRCLCEGLRVQWPAACRLKMLEESFESCENWMYACSVVECKARKQPLISYKSILLSLDEVLGKVTARLLCRFGSGHA